jgi:hypothetical protein
MNMETYATRYDDVKHIVNSVKLTKPKKDKIFTSAFDTTDNLPYAKDKMRIRKKVKGEEISTVKSKAFCERGQGLGVSRGGIGTVYSTDEFLKNNKRKNRYVSENAENGEIDPEMEEKRKKLKKFE